MNKKIESKIFRTTLLTTIAVCLGIVACNNETKTPNSNDPKKIAEEHNEAKFNKVKEKEAQFVVDAAEMNIEEINLGKLAQSQAKARDVKELGKKMEEDHSKSMKELEALAAKKIITIPTEMTNDATDNYNKLKNKTGDNFDSQYCKMMVDAHKDAVDKFEKISTDAEDYEIKTWAGKMLPSLRANLDLAMTCDEKYNHNDEDKKIDHNARHDKNIILKK
jgi:putative membrane protein